MVAPHVNYQQCYETAKVGLASGNELASFLCPKYGEVCCDPAELGSSRLNMDVLSVDTSGPSIHLC